MGGWWVVVVGVVGGVGCGVWCGLCGGGGWDVVECIYADILPQNTMYSNIR